MPPAPRIQSDYLRPLAALTAIQQGAAAYYRELRQSKDPVLTVGALVALLETKQISNAQWDDVLTWCRYGAVRRRAYTYFVEAFEPAYARKAAMIDAVSTAALEAEAMLARLDFDGARAAELEGKLYLETGDVTHLQNASDEAETAAGWRPGLEWAVRGVAVAPLNPATVQRLFVVLESSGQPEILEEVAELFTSRNMYLQISQVFLAAAAMARGNAALCLTKLRPLDDAKVTANTALRPYLGAIRALRAQAEERLGNYRQAYEAYVALNAAEREATIDPTHFVKGVEVRNRLTVPALPPDSHHPVVQMLGFPRSGTTLLENALNAHPSVETFEEVPALAAAIDRIERVLMRKVPPESPETTFSAARARYYDDIESRRHKAGAEVLIDKLPIRSAEADLLKRLFPEWRYIFSIRHPFDVILSCFKQRFGPNPAMENFRTIEQASKLYDFTMTEWFKQHTMEDSTVHYVRYDDLVTDFEPVMRGTLEFLGLDWDDEVRDFARAAERRAVKTPSYHKVRQGLSIGVQTAWRNYDFVFQSAAAGPLHKWAEFFAYPTT